MRGRRPPCAPPPTRLAADLGDNDLTGPLPELLLRNVSSALTRISLDSNRLTGPVLESFARLGSLEYLDLASNLFTGIIPGAFAQLRSLAHLDLTNNLLTGVVPLGVFALLSGGLRTLRLRARSRSRLVPPGGACLGLRGMAGSLPRRPAPAHGCARGRARLPRLRRAHRLGAAASECRAGQAQRLHPREAPPGGRRP